MTISTSKDVYYDPYDDVLNADPEGRIALEQLLKRFPEWEVDLTNARLSPTSTVRGWESMPALVP
ncbi:hypothetical protein AWC06_09430 [Mycobacterium fragae]|uniref:Uncharacterized protein n=1 Tax=Mycobacterium fragae TaxID=1260918 RepID=A0A1X1V373_9MYCO|nr:hypothetical protein AWC06_09430 [Mycobacterium fragae]